MQKTWDEGSPAITLYDFDGNWVTWSSRSADFFNCSGEWLRSNAKYV